MNEVVPPREQLVTLCQGLIKEGNGVAEVAKDELENDHRKTEAERSRITQMVDKHIKLTEISELPGNIETVIINKRGIRESETLLDGEDPGVFVCLTAKMGTGHRRFFINIHGGIREKGAPADMRDTVEGSSSGKGHAARTRAILSEPTDININIVDTKADSNHYGQTMKRSNLWIRVLPTNPPGCCVYNLVVYEGSVTQSLDQPVFLPDDTGQYSAGRLRNFVNQLLEQRDQMMQHPAEI